MKIEFYRHNLNEKDIDNVVKVLNSVFLTTGATVAEFEEKFARYMGCKYMVGVNSCTAALHLALLAYGIGPGDEVITTPMTFIATPDAVLYTGATPVFVDVEPDTANINANLIEKAITKKTRAIMPVHMYGQMCDMKKIKEIAKKHKLIIIEDVAHGIEAKRDGIRPCELGDAGCFSFYATKTITCGEGGAIGTNDAAIAEKLKKLRLHGMSKGAAERYTEKYQHWDMEMLGWKYNMTNIQAALLLDQLERIDKYWERREEISRMYEKAFHDNPNVKTMAVLPDSKNARYAFTILVAPEKRDNVLGRLQEKGIGVAVNFRAIHLLTYYRKTFGYKRGMFPIAEKIGDSTITIPLYPKLTKEEVAYIIKAVQEVTK